MKRFFTRFAAVVRFVAPALLVLALCLIPSISEAAKKKTAPPPPPDLSMRFAIVRASSPLCEPICPEWIWAEGAIEAGTPARFNTFLKTVGKRKLPIIIQSPGGDVDAAMAIGRTIRKRGIDVAVGYTNFSSCAPRQKDCDLAKSGGFVGFVSTGFAYCNSACPLLLAGGTRRLVGSQAYLGVHQITTTMVKERIEYRTLTRVVKGKKVVTKKIVGRKRTGSYTTTKMAKGLRKKLEAYLKEMGISKIVIDRMNETPAADLLQLAPYEMSALKLTTSFDQADVLTGLAVCKQEPMPANCREAPMTPAMAAEVAKVAQIAAASLARKQVQTAEQLKAKETAWQGAPRDLGRPMRFAVVRSVEAGCEPTCPEWIAAEGIIQKDSADRLASLLGQLDQPRLPVILWSNGGDIDGAMALGRLIRQKGLDTAVGRQSLFGCRETKTPCDLSQDFGGAYFGRVSSSGEARCLNNCVLAFAGGGKRIAAPPVSISVEGIRRQWLILPRLRTYFAEMGVSTKLLDESFADPLTERSQWSYRKFALLTDGRSVDVVAGAGICKNALVPSNCRDQAKSETLKTVTPARTGALIQTAAKAAMQRPPAAAARDIGRPMRFAVVRLGEAGCEPLCPEWIAAEGVVQKDSASRLDDLLERLGRPNLPIVLTSNGGDIDGAMALGRLIWQKGLNTAVGRQTLLGCLHVKAPCDLSQDFGGAYLGNAVSADARCLNSCVLVLAAGKMRLSGKSTLLTFDVLASWWQMAPLMKEYLREMKVSERLLDERRAGTLDHQSQLRLFQLGLLSGIESVDYVAGGAVCKRVNRPDNCRAPAKPETLAALKPPEKPAVAKRPATKGTPVVLVRGSSPLCEPICPEWISMEGPITAETTRQLEDLLARIGERPLPVILASDGGSLADAMATGRIIRAKGLSVAIGVTRFLSCSPAEPDCRPDASGAYRGMVDIHIGRCSYSCALVFAGGVTRLYDFNRQMQLSSLGSRRHFEAYLAEMGVGEGIMDLMETFGPGAGEPLDSYSAVRNRFTTDYRSANVLIDPKNCKAANVPPSCRLIEARGAQVLN